MRIASASACLIQLSKEAKKECSSEENKKECCSSKKDSTQSHDHGVGEAHNHDQNEE